MLGTGARRLLGAEHDSKQRAAWALPCPLPPPPPSQLPTILLGLQERGLERHPVPGTCFQLGRRMLGTRLA